MIFDFIFERLKVLILYNFKEGDLVNNRIMNRYLVFKFRWYLSIVIVLNSCMFIDWGKLDMYCLMILEYF